MRTCLAVLLVAFGLGCTGVAPECVAGRIAPVCANDEPEIGADGMTYRWLSVCGDEWQASCAGTSRGVVGGAASCSDGSPVCGGGPGAGDEPRCERILCDGELHGPGG